MPDFVRVAEDGGEALRSPKAIGSEYIFRFGGIGLRESNEPEKQLHGPLLPTVVLELRDVYVSAQGYVFDLDGRPVLGNEFQLRNPLNSPRNSSQKVLGPEKPIELKGRYVHALLEHRAFGHFLLHKAPRIASCALLDFESVLLNAPHFGFSEFETVLGHPRIRWLSNRFNEFVRVESLLVSSSAAIRNRWRTANLERVNAPGIQWKAHLGASQSKSVKSRCDCSGKPQDQIYLSRPRSGVRKGCSNPEVIDSFFESRGIPAFEPTEHSFSCQVGTVRAARHIFVEAGSASDLIHLRGVEASGSLTYLTPSPLVFDDSGALNAPWARASVLQQGGSYFHVELGDQVDLRDWYVDAEKLSRAVDSVLNELR